MDSEIGYFNTNHKDVRRSEDSEFIYHADMLAAGLARLYTELWLKGQGYKSDLTIEVITAEIEKLLAEYLQHRREFAENDPAGLLDPERMGFGDGYIVASIEADVAHAKRRKYGKMH